VVQRRYGPRQLRRHVTNCDNNFSSTRSICLGVARKGGSLQWCVCPHPMPSVTNAFVGSEGQQLQPPVLSSGERALLLHIRAPPGLLHRLEQSK